MSTCPGLFVSSGVSRALCFYNDHLPLPREASPPLSEADGGSPTGTCQRPGQSRRLLSAGFRVPSHSPAAAGGETSAVNPSAPPLGQGPSRSAALLAKVTSAGRNDRAGRNAGAGPTDLGAGSTVLLQTTLSGILPQRCSRHHAGGGSSSCKTHNIYEAIKPSERSKAGRARMQSHLQADADSGRGSGPAPVIKSQGPAHWRARVKGLKAKKEKKKKSPKAGKPSWVLKQGEFIHFKFAKYLF